MSKNRKQLTVSMIISGIILISIISTYFIFQSNQWVQNNAYWFVFTSGIVILVFGIIILLSTKK